jgi:hypothetical protein
MKPKINPFWGYLTLALVVLTVALCILGAKTGVLLIRTDAKPQDTAETFFESLVIGKYEAADQCLENYGSLGLDRSPRTEEGKQVWTALLASYDYTLEGEPQVKRDTAVQTVRLRYLDRNALDQALTAAGEGDAPSLQTLLEHAEDYYTNQELSVTLHYVDGRWLIYADEALLSALSGGK